ncbi:HAD family hydrolase [Streptomyces sp. NRRL WC-3742]|uniref:HAD family hydrolase n=1 Tax=Streptomyces sp. NRRL WC-3742 TaxID=1463934 RepID=UPI0004C5F80B|nr:HAD family hydrolase [Streptomyces sp. NRRL WC-3742]
MSQQIEGIRGVLFDIDDTLYDYTGCDRTGLLAHLGERGLLGRFPDAEAAVGLWREIMEVQYARFLTGELTFSGQQRARAREFLDHLGEDGSTLTDEQAAAWFAGYVTHRDAARSAFPDADPTLAALAPHHRLGIVSNSSLHHQREKLDITGLLHHFPADEVLICSDEFGQPKPAAAIFHAGCAALGLAPGEVAYVGDRHDVDGLGARDAGLTAFWLDRTGIGGTPAPGVHLLRGLDELPSLLGH